MAEPSKCKLPILPLPAIPSFIFPPPLPALPIIIITFKCPLDKL